MLNTESWVQYTDLISTIGNLLNHARSFAYQQVNTILIETYREIGKHIVEYEQNGKEKAEYGSQLFDRLAKDLKKWYGKWFSRSNLYVIRQFYIKYPIFQALPGKLTRTHFAELLIIENDLERSFYEQQTINENRSTREMKRQIESSLYQRLALSKDKEWVLELSKKWITIKESKDILKDPYILDFLWYSENSIYSESNLEQKIIDNLQKFIMELWKWFTFVARQYRITLNNTHYYIDLVFYHRILKCFVLIDLKTKKIKHWDIGQMNMYLNYFKKEEMTEGDNEPIGIILAKDKEHAMVEYALGWITNQLFVSKYQLYLPNKEELQEKVNGIVGTDE